MRPGHQIAARVGLLKHGDSLALGGAVCDGMPRLVAQLAGGAVVDDERPEAVVHETVAILVQTSISRQYFRPLPVSVNVLTCTMPLRLVGTAKSHDPCSI